MSETMWRVLILAVFGIVIINIAIMCYWFAFYGLPRKKRYVPLGPIYTEQYLQTKIDTLVYEAVSKEDWSVCLSLPSSVKYFNLNDPIIERSYLLLFNDFVVSDAQQECVTEYLQRTSDSKACDYYPSEERRNDCLMHFSEKIYQIRSFFRPCARVSGLRQSSSAATIRLASSAPSFGLSTPFGHPIPSPRSAKNH
jgi:hypothetical protein